MNENDQNRLRNTALSVVRHISVIHNCDGTPPAPPAPPGDFGVADGRVEGCRKGGEARGTETEIKIGQILPKKAVGSALAAR